MAKPRKPRAGEDPNDIHWLSDPVHLERLRLYCETDVEVERACIGACRRCRKANKPCGSLMR